MSTRIMAIDTATEACSVAIWNDGQVYSHFEVCPREHTQRILPMVEGVLAEAGLTLEELDALAFGQGPGSFTGVRIGVGIAQGLALGANLPTIGISTLQAMAQGAHRLGGATHVLSAIDARMGEIYWGAYLLDESLGWITVRDEQVILPEKAMEQMASLEGEWYSVGTGWQIYPDMMQSPSIHIHDGNVQLPTALDMLPLALIRWANGEASTVAEAQPVYLRNEVSWQKLSGR